MKQNPFGPLGPVSRIGQGTWRLDDDERAGAVAALRAGLDAGMSHVDTAEMYGSAEPLVAEALGDRRDEIFMVSKVCRRTLRSPRPSRPASGASSG